MDFTAIFKSYNVCGYGYRNFTFGYLNWSLEMSSFLFAFSKVILLICH